VEPPVRTELDNGIRVLSDHMPEVRSVSIGFWVGAGSRDEPQGLEGATHFLEHLLFKGTESRTARDIAEAVDAVGGELNAYTTKEFTAYYARVLDDDIALALDILSDITRHPAFPEKEVEAERKVILEEIRMRDDTPDDLVHDVFYEALWPDHALGRAVLGNIESVEGIARNEIADYFGDYYRPGNLVVAAAGSLDHEDLCERIAVAFRGTKGGREVEHSAPPPVTPRVRIVSRESEQAHLVLGTEALSRSDPDRYVLGVLTHIVGGGMSSRLFQEVREKRGLAYSVYSYRSPYRETGTFGVYCGTSPPSAREVLKIVRRELEDLANGGVTGDELRRAKGHVRGSLALSLEDSGSRMTRLGRNELVDSEILTIDEVVARVESVTEDDVTRLAERLFRPGRFVLAVVGPFAEGDLAGIVN
jgi:predicted Zn-dependent peptidase